MSEVLPFAAPADIIILGIIASSYVQLACAHTRCLREGWLEVRKRRRIAGWGSWKMRWAEVLQDGTFALYKSAGKRTNDLRYHLGPCLVSLGALTGLPIVP